MLNDLRVSFRSLAKTPGFTLTAVAALALGIGANAAIFSVVNQVLLNPAGVAQPGRMVALRAKYDKLDLKSIPVSAPDFADVRDSRSVFERSAMLNQTDFNYLGPSGPQRLQGALVTSEWFDVFGARPILGRVFRPEEDQPNANTEVVLAYAAWQRIFGGDPGILGRAVTFNDKPYRVIGVMGRDFRWPLAVELWSPLGLAAADFAPGNRFNENYVAFARLRPGITVARANATIQTLADRVRSSGDQLGSFAKDSAWGMFALPLTDFVAGDTREPLLILLGAVGFVLLIACSNIAGLLLARTSARAREIAVRVALGAGRWVLARQVLAESVLLAGAGTLAGLALAAGGIRALLLLAPEQYSAGLAPRMDLPVLAFTVCASVLSALLFSLAPIWRLGSIDPQAALKSGGRAGTAGRPKQRARAALVVAETALALVLLIGAGLFVRSLVRLEEVRPGFDPHGVLTAQISLPASRYPGDPQRIPYLRATVDRLTAAPGVTHAAFGLPLPFTGGSPSNSFSIKSQPTGPGDPGPHGDIRFVSPAYFAALRIPLKQGRMFTDFDTDSTELVAVIDENLARQYWPGGNALGDHLRGGVRGNDWATIVGIVGHVHQSDLATDTGKGVYYYSMWQRAAPIASIVLQTAGNPAAFGGAVREAVRATDPAQPVFDIKTLDDLVAASLAPRLFVVRMLASFAVAALLLAGLGLYGVVSYSVAQRTQEIGIRMALGARREQVLGMVIRHGVRLAAIGAGVGLAAAVLLAAWLKTQLWGVSAFDPLTLGGTILALLAAAAVASYVPARRATKVDPIDALRWE
jgi:predicted permease